MTDIIQELRGLIEKATPGPWETVETKIPWSIASGKQGNHTERRIATTWDHPQSRAPSPVVTGSVGLGFDGGPPAHLVHISEEDAALIVAAINNLPALLDRLEAAERGMKLMREGIRRANERVGGIETERMNRDNLSIILCSYFEDAEGEQDENGWTLAATEGCDEVLAAIRDHYSAAIDAALVGEG